MEFSLEHLQPKERASFALRSLYETAGCRKYHMGRFEEYSLYQENRSFLSSEQVITFTDLDGRLLALKPDVTLSIAKTAQPAPCFIRFLPLFCFSSNFRLRLTSPP